MIPTNSRVFSSSHVVEDEERAHKGRWQSKKGDRLHLPTVRGLMDWRLNNRNRQARRNPMHKID